MIDISGGVRYNSNVYDNQHCSMADWLSMGKRPLGIRGKLKPELAQDKEYNCSIHIRTVNGVPAMLFHHFSNRPEWIQRKEELMHNNNRLALWAGKLISAIFVVIIITSILATIVIEKNCKYPGIFSIPNWVCYMLSVVVLGGVIFACKKLKNFLSAWFIPLLTILVLVTTVLLVRVSLCMPEEWPNSSDSLNVRIMATHLAQGFDLKSTFIEKNLRNYFLKFANNINIAFLFSRIYRLFSTYRAVVVIGALCSAVSYLLILLSIYNLSRDKGLTLMLGILAMPFFLLIKRSFSPYTDNYPLLFVALFVYISTLTLRPDVKWLLLLMTSLLGALLKITVLIPLIAFALAMTLYPNERNRSVSIRAWIITAIISLVLILGFVKADDAIKRFCGYEDTDRTVGWQYYFMLGQDTKGQGTAAGKAFREVWKICQKSGATREERNRVFVQKGLEWIRTRGFFGNLAFYFKKLDIAYIDGQFNSHNQAIEEFLPPGLLSGLYSSSGAAFPHITNVMQVFWDCILILLLLGSFQKPHSPAENRVSGFLKTGMLGVTFYLLLFEDRSRYVWMFLPVYLTFAGLAISRLVSSPVFSGNTIKGMRQTMKPIQSLPETAVRDTPLLHIVIPCYNEEQALPITADHLTKLLDTMIGHGEIRADSRIVLVDDGSTDATWKVITALHEESERFEGIKLAHNAGHMNALWAGMSLSADRCDCVITIDADLQDDINAMVEFIQEYRKGADVVYGVRSSRQTDTFFKRNTAQWFYRLMNGLGVEMVYNHADYRLLSARALHALLSFGEVNMFLRGMVPMLGFKSAKVYYERRERVAGESKYPLKKMLAFAAEGITSTTNKPIRYVLVMGVFCVLLGIVMAIYVLISMIQGHSVAGWASMMMSMWLLGGLNLAALGIIGEYIGKIYMETKHRPRFILEEHLRNH